MKVIFVNCYILVLLFAQIVNNSYAVTPPSGLSKTLIAITSRSLSKSFVEVAAGRLTTQAEILSSKLVGVVFKNKGTILAKSAFETVSLRILSSAYNPQVRLALKQAGAKLNKEALILILHNRGYVRTAKLIEGIASKSPAALETIITCFKNLL